MRFQTRFWVAVQESFSFQDFDRPSGVVCFFVFVFQKTFLIFLFSKNSFDFFLFQKLFLCKNFCFFLFTKKLFCFSNFVLLFAFAVFLFSFFFFSFRFCFCKKLFCFSLLLSLFFAKKTFCSIKNFHHEKRPLKVSFQKKFLLLLFAFLLHHCCDLPSEFYFFLFKLSPFFLYKLSKLWK